MLSPNHWPQFRAFENRTLYNATLRTTPNSVWGLHTPYNLKGSSYVIHTCLVIRPLRSKAELAFQYVHQNGIASEDVASLAWFCLRLRPS